MSLNEGFRFDRRTLLIGGGVGVGLVIALTVLPALRRGDANRDHALGAYLKVGRDGRVIVAVPQVETGQGIWTALPQIAADELGADWQMVAVEPAPFDDIYANRLAAEEGWFAGLGSFRRFRLDDAAGRITAGSTSVRAFEQAMREAGAAARAMLIKAAAARWNVDESECDTRSGRVVQGARSLGFGELAEEAAGHDPPRSPQFQAGRGALIGKPLQRLDLPAKSDGSFRFTGDVRLPDMLFAAARMAPPGGRIGGFRQSAAIMSGEGWIAATGETSWAAQRALDAAAVRFEVPQMRVPLNARMDDALAAGEAENWFSSGDYAPAVEGSRALTALYRVAPAMHLGLEPATATARLSGGQLEVWAAAQAPELARRIAKRFADGAAVTFYPMPPGDQGGRAMEPDAIQIAIELARQLKRAVQATLFPSASQNADRPAPAALARMYALPGAGGIPAAWKMRLVTASALGSSLSRLAGGDVQASLTASAGGGAPPYAIPNVQIDAVAADLPYLSGYMRGSPDREIAFFIESFIDELARAAGLEPFAFRMAMLGQNPRLARCLQQVASASDWDGGARGSTMGIAACSAFGSHIALVAEATVGAGQTIEVHRLVATVDCGRMANQDLVKQQIQGGLLWALAQAVVPGPEWLGPMPKARPIGGLGLPRLAHTPEIRVDLVDNNLPPGGVNGLGVAVLAPAVANAIYAGTGKRLRNLPFDPMAVA